MTADARDDAATVRADLEDGASPGRAEYIYPEGWAALARLEAAAARTETLETALHTVRAECDLPEHIAEIVGAALAGGDAEI